MASNNRSVRMSKPHTITLDELKDTIIKQQIAASYGKGENKELVFEYSLPLESAFWTVNSRNGSESFTDLEDAIRAYNGAW